jgi:hypothetical protein
MISAAVLPKRFYFTFTLQSDIMIEKILASVPMHDEEEPRKGEMRRDEHEYESISFFGDVSGNRGGIARRHSGNFLRNEAGYDVDNDVFGDFIVSGC